MGSRQVASDFKRGLILIHKAGKHANGTLIGGTRVAQLTEFLIE
jgi:hypothetical protein